MQRGPFRRAFWTAPGARLGRAGRSAVVLVTVAAVAAGSGCASILGLERAELGDPAVGSAEDDAGGGDGAIDTRDYSAQVIADGAIAYYPFDEGAGTSTARNHADGQAPRARDGQVVGATFGLPGARGGDDGAIVSDGVEARVDLAWAGVPSGNQPFTVELAVRPDFLYPDERVIVSHPDAREGAFLGWRLVAKEDDVRFERVATDGVEVVRADGVLAVNAWTHLGVTFDGARLRLVVEGTIAEEIRTERQLLGAGERVVVGSASIEEAPYPGRIDELAIYDREVGPDVLGRHARRLVP